MKSVVAKNEKLNIESVYVPQPGPGQVLVKSLACGICGSDLAKPISNAEVRSAAERHAAITWVQRLKRVFNIDIEVCGRCGGTVRVIACIEDQDVIDRILAHLRDKEPATPSLPLLTPPSRAPPETWPLFAGKESSPTAVNQQGSH